MKRLSRRFLMLSVVAAVATGAVAAPSYAAPPAWRAHAYFDRTNPYDPSGCIHLKLDLRVTSTTAYVDYWATDTCFGFDYDHLTGSTTLAPNQVSLGSFDSAALSNVAVTVTGAGYFQAFTFNLTWSGSGRITISHPTGPSGEVARQTAAAVSGSVVDLGGSTLFSGSNVADAEIAQIIHVLG
jgi:hypothetical protein